MRRKMRRQKEKGKNRYICCIWCGREMKNPYAQYCSDRCRREARGQEVR